METRGIDFGMSRNGRGLTLVELLIVVATLSVLVAAAAPNYLEAQTRAKVSASRANINAILVGLEVYATDHNAYPPTRPVFPVDRLGLLADVQFGPLVTPIGYLSGESFRDPFAAVREQLYFRQRAGRPAPLSTNPAQSLLYYNYMNLAENWEMPCLARKGAGVLSLGPDSLDSLGAYRPFSRECFNLMYPESYDSDAHHPLNTIYDPTNGTISTGDVMGFAGDARIFIEQ